ncbi:hypothetical protein O181_033974 [Austropuccinia psidii MF-1]|uniref:Pentatricopeptide repeat-containing protein n=1 Tax=Austropuccinia psidii MF-1 TaxID=1389203 RepID=A0A9Q3H926_9BASI|nr:hypothetical protein [Austropuccinia psidii MF-1]
MKNQNKILIKIFDSVEKINFLNNCNLYLWYHHIHHTNHYQNRHQHHPQHHRHTNDRRRNHHQIRFYHPNQSSLNPSFHSKSNATASSLIISSSAKSSPSSSLDNSKDWWKLSNCLNDSFNFNSKSKIKKNHYKHSENFSRIQSLNQFKSQLNDFFKYQNLSLNPSSDSIYSNHQFQSICQDIWSDLYQNEDRQIVMEIQIQAIDHLLNLFIQSFNQNQVQYLQNSFHLDFFLHTLIFVTSSPYSHRIIPTLGLDPIKGWRNPVRQHLRLKTLRSLISFINTFHSDPSKWWLNQISNPSINHFQAIQLTKIGLFLIISLSKQGSITMALKLFWEMDRLTHFFPSSSSTIVPSPIFSPHYRAATALSLVDALWSRKDLDSIEQILNKINLDPSLGSIYHRYLLNLLFLKAARGDLMSVKQIGNIYQSVGKKFNLDSLNGATGRNKRSRGFLLQDPKVLVARAEIEALGIIGDVHQAIQVFQNIIDTVPPQLGLFSQLPDLYAEMIKAHMRADDPRAIENLLSRMISTPDPHRLNQPDQRHFNILLQTYANRLDIEGCSSVLDKMISCNLSIDIYTLGNVCLLLANLGETESIRQVIESLTTPSSLDQSPSFKPNRELWNILLDGYVESGDWARAAKLLEYLQLDDQRHRDSDIVTNGIVLKALVLSGCPTDEVLETFKAMYNHQTGLSADIESYTLLLLSICDAGMMDLAEAIFHTLRENSNRQNSTHRRPPVTPTPNVYMYGIMISAFLRLGKRKAAEDYLKEMRLAGITPNLVIYSMLTSAYASSSSSTVTNQETDGADEEDEERQADGMQVARDMATSFKRDLLNSQSRSRPFENEFGLQKNSRGSNEWPLWTERNLLRKKLSHRLLGPIIQSYVKSARPAKALEVFRELVANLGHGFGIRSGAVSPIDIDIYTMLLDGYRKAQDPLGVMEIWREIVRLASETDQRVNLLDDLLDKVHKLIHPAWNNDKDEASFLKSAERRQARRANKLCLPLSIFTECLSRHGHHEEVARTWYELQQQGFGFDAGNWNELCVAMFRSGNHQMGWSIAERVFCGRPDVGEDEENDIEIEESNLASILAQTAGLGKGRLVEGLGSTRLSGARETESPIRPPNRTSVRRTKRFDDLPKTRMSVHNLLDSLRDSDSSPTWEEEEGEEGRMSKAVNWSHQLKMIDRARKRLKWKPYQKVFRMLHGSMWRECSDLVIRKWEEHNAEVNGNDRNEMNMLEIENKTIKDVREIVDGYARRYPKTMMEMLRVVNECKDETPKGMNQKEMFEWSKEDFVIRVIRRTIELIGE